MTATRILLFLALTFFGCAARAALQDPEQLVLEAEALVLQAAQSYPGHAEVGVAAPRITKQPACDQLQLQIAGSGTLQPRTPLIARCLAPEPWSLSMYATVRIMGHFYVARRQIPRATTIDSADVELRSGDLLRNKRALTAESEVLGWSTTRSIRMGSAIESSALRDPNSIERGQMVRTIIHGKGFVATSEAQAMESASPGMQIQLRTAQGQVITGTVLDSLTVQILN